MLKENEYNEYNAMEIREIARSKKQYQEVIKGKYKNKEELMSKLDEIEGIDDLLPGYQKEAEFCEFVDRDRLFSESWKRLLHYIDDGDEHDRFVDRMSNIEQQLNRLANDVWEALVIQMAIHDGVEIEES